jgi:DNA-binding IclR family transcriptional regulator
MSGKGTGLLQSVERALRVLDHVAAAPGPVPAKEVARALGLTVSTTYHLLTTLVNGGYLVHLPEDRAYALGHRVDDLARALHRQIAVPAEVERVATVIHQQAGAAAYYAALRDAEMIVAHVVECARHPRIRTLDVGFHQAPHATAFGKLMLATLDSDLAQQILESTGAPPVTAATVTVSMPGKLEFSQCTSSPDRHGRHSPQVTSGCRITASPGATLVTASPTSRTQPAFSWPMTYGSETPDFSAN